MHRRRNPDLIGGAKDLAVMVGLGAALYLLYGLVAGFDKAKKTATSMYDQTGELFDRSPDPTGDTFVSWYDPTQRIVFFYYLTFPDGSQHFVWASDVNTDGTFVSNDTLYRIGTDRSGGLRAYDYSSMGA